MTLAGVALALAGFPLALAFVNLLAYRRPKPAWGCPQVSVLIPARNEETNIGAAVACALASEAVEVEVVVLDDHSTDGTASVLAAIEDRRLRVVPAAALPAGWSGKQHACATLAGLAAHELMVFVDADVRLARDAVARMAGAMQRRPSVGLASGFPRLVLGTWAERLLLPMIHVLLLGYLPMPVSRAVRAPPFGAGCGQLFIARRDAYRRAGGHAAIRASLHDGITLPRAFRRAGIMTDLFDASSFASCRMYQDAAQVWEGLTKNATEGMATPRALPAWTLLLAGGHLLPWVLVATSPSVGAGAAVLCSLGLRALVAVRFGQRPRDVALQPLSVLAALIVQWAALVRVLRGRPATWRGRVYPAQ